MMADMYNRWALTLTPGDLGRLLLTYTELSPPANAPDWIRKSAVSSVIFGRLPPLWVCGTPHDNSAFLRHSCESSFITDAERRCGPSPSPPPTRCTVDRFVEIGWFFLYRHGSTVPRQGARCRCLPRSLREQFSAGPAGIGIEMGPSKLKLRADPRKCNSWVQPPILTISSNLAIVAKLGKSQMFIKLAFEFGCDVILMSHPITQSLGSKLQQTSIFAMKYSFFTNQTGAVW